MGLLAEIMGRDCTAGGATSGAEIALMVDFDGPFEPRAEIPSLVCVETDPERHGPGYLNVPRGCRVAVRARAVPVDHDGIPKLGGMFGGHFVWSSDSRFGYESPVPVFDRFEF